MDEIEKQLEATSTPEGLRVRIMGLAKVEDPRLKPEISKRASICACCSNLSRLHLKCGKSPCSEQFNSNPSAFIDNKLCNLAFHCPIKLW